FLKTVAARSLVEIERRHVLLFESCLRSIHEKSDQIAMAPVGDQPDQAVEDHFESRILCRLSSLPCAARRPRCHRTPRPRETRLKEQNGASRDDRTVPSV